MIHLGFHSIAAEDPIIKRGGRDPSYRFNPTIERKKIDCFSSVFGIHYALLRNLYLFKLRFNLTLNTCSI